MESILGSVKKTLGINYEDNSFDTDILIAINTAFSILTQVGMGPITGYSISDENDLWEDYLDDHESFSKLEMVKTFVCTKARLIFDPPSTSFAIEALNKIADELLWRISVEVSNTKGG